MAIPLFQIDSFTSEPFRGNPAGVCLLDGDAGAAWMQNVAAEMNLSETAFLPPRGEAWSLRWFTPTTEVRLCGHATLASAHALWEAGRLGPDQPAVFDTVWAGRLTCRKKGDWIEMDFPADPSRAVPAPPTLAAALGAEPVATFLVGGPTSGGTFLVEYPDEAAVRSMQPDFAAMLAGGHGSAIVTSRADGPYDFVSRCFVPCEGINEDPVTGSAHCSLGPFWGRRLGKSEVVGLQVSRRGGVVKVALAGERVKLSGQAVTVFRAELFAQ